MSKPAGKKLTCVTDHGTFTKTTSRTYTHVVVGEREGKPWPLWVGRPELIHARVEELTKRHGYKHLGTYEVQQP